MKSVIRSFWRACVNLNHDGGLAIASNIALSLLLSLFPFLMLIASLVRLYGEPELANEVVELLFGHWPAGSAKPIESTLETLLAQPAGEFFSISTIVALVLASNGVESARDGLNRAYRVTEIRPFYWRRLQGAFFVLAGALGLILAAFILVGTPLMWNFLTGRFEWLTRFEYTVALVQYGIAITILGLVLYAFHRFLPNLGKTRPSMIWGILLTISGILIGSKLFGLYLQNIANYTAVYAGLAGMMIAIVYLYFISVLILLGAEFNMAMADQRSEQIQNLTGQGADE